MKNFIRLKQILRFASDWFSLYGKPYSGGCRNMPRLGKFQSCQASLSIYHQEYDGAKNYHEPDSEFRFYINKATEIFAPEICKKALELLKEDLALAAKEAEAEASEILAVAKEISVTEK